MKKGTKKLLSLLLALAMILTLAPIAVFAEDEPVTGEPVVVEEPVEPADPGTVYVVVYGSALTAAIDAITPDGKLFEPTYSWGRENGDNGTAGAIKSVTDTIPAVDIVLVAADGTEIALNEATDVKGSALVSDVREEGVDSYAAELDKMSASGYKVFTADVEPGTYMVSVKSLEEPYGLANLAYLSSNVTVEAGQTVFAGDTKAVKGYSEKTEKKYVRTETETYYEIWDIFKRNPKTREVDIFEDVTSQYEHTLNFKGYFLRKETLGFKFRTTDVAGDPVQGAEFVMVNRDDLLNLLKPVIGVGQAAFSKAIENLGNPEVFSFEELVQLHTNLLKQNEQGYIALDMNSVYGIIQAYLGLLSGVGPEVLAQFINYDEAGNFAGLKYPIPAVLKATSDENGIVTFTESSNITLTWLIQILLDFGVGTLNGLAANNPLLGFATPLLQMIQLVMDPDSVDVESLNSRSFLDLVKSIPGIEGNDFVQTALDAAGGIFGGVVDAILTTDVKRSIVNWIHDNLYDPIMNFVYGQLQNFGIVGDKISKGNYLLFEYKTPDAVLDEEGNVVEDFSRSPLVYTVNVDWKEPDNIYASVTDLGLIGPYIAPQFYDFVRNTQYEGVVAKYFGKKAWDYDFLSKLMTGRIALAEKEKQQVEGAFTAFMAYSLYDALGLDLIFNTRTALMEGMNDYLVSQKDTATNLRNYVNTQAKKAKSVYAGSLTPLSAEVEADDLWTFYTLDASPTLTATKLIDKSTKDIAAAFPEGSERQKGILQNGGTVSSIVSRIGNSIEGAVKSVVSRIQEAIGSAVENAIKSVTDGVKNIFTGLLKNLFNNSNETPSNAGA